MAISALVLASCGGAGDDGGDSGDSRLTVVATTTILGDVVSSVVGEDARVEVLTPVGADPHDFRPSARQVAALSQADLVVSIGLGLEEGLEDVLDSAVGDGVEVLELAPLLDPIPFGSPDHQEESDDHDDESDDHEDGVDPHVWMDPLRMAEAARIIATRLSTLDPSTDWTEQAELYAAELVDADEEIAEILSSVPASQRRLVTNHDSLGYFATRYGFEVVGVVIPGGSTLGEPSSERLANLIEVMRREGVKVLFAETTHPSALADAVADELGGDVRVVELFSGSLGEPGSGAENLVEMLVTNAERVAEALGG